MESKTKKLISNLIHTIIAFIMASMVIMIFANAVARYLFNSGFPVFEELSRYAFIWISFSGAILVYFQNGHVGVDMLVVALKGKNKLIIQLLGDLIVIMAIIIIIIGGWRYLEDTALVLSPATNLPTGIISSSAAIMGIIMLFKSVLNIKDHIDDYQNFKKEEEVL